MPIHHKSDILTSNPLRRDIIGGSSRRDYRRFFEIIVNLINRSTSLYSSKWQEHQQNALKINLIFLKFNVRFSSRNRVICSDPKLVMGLLGTGFKEHMFSGQRRLTQEHCSASEYLQMLDEDFKFIEDKYGHNNSMTGQTSAYYFVRFLIDPVIKIANMSDRISPLVIEDEKGQKQPGGVSDRVSNTQISEHLFSRWVDFTQVPENHKSENPFLSKSGGWLQNCDQISRSDQWKEFINNVAQWESHLEKGLSSGSPDGYQIKMHDSGQTTRALRAIDQHVDPSELLVPTHDRNLNNILLKFKELLVEVRPSIQEKINQDDILYNFFTALESEVNKGKNGAKVGRWNYNTHNKEGFRETEYLYRYAVSFLPIIQHSVDQYNHHIENQKDLWDARTAHSSGFDTFSPADPMGAISPYGQLTFWGDVTINNSSHYRDGWHSKTGRIRAIYYSLYITHIEAILKTTRSFQDHLALYVIREIYHQAIESIIDCLSHSFSSLKETSSFGGQKGQYSFYSLLAKNTSSFAKDIVQVINRDKKALGDKQQDRIAKDWSRIYNYWNKSLPNYKIES